jgi:hypothetical protein
MTIHNLSNDLPTHRTGPIYVASRASIPSRSEMWRKLRDEGWRITSTWIDEAGSGETANLRQLWDRIHMEIRQADKLVLYAEAGDFPLKGALIETGIALGLNKPVVVCLPSVVLDPVSLAPLGSWIAHPFVSRNDDLLSAMAQVGFSPRRQPLQYPPP